MSNKDDKLDIFLRKFICKTGQPFTHTRIGSNTLGVSGGSYFIPQDKYNDFYKLYVNKVFINDKQEYLTEKQPEKGPLLIDIDFRYNEEVDERQHTSEDIINFLQIITEKLEKIYTITNNKEIMLYVFEKDNVNCLENVTKDGIHIMTNISMDITSKTLLRNMLIEQLPKIWNNIPIINSWDDVLDSAVMKCNNNWQLIGSRKPGNEAYKLVNYYKAKYIDNVDGWDFNEETETFDYKENFFQLSCRTMETIEFDFNPDIKPQYDIIYNSKKNKSFSKKINKTKKIKRLDEITCEDDLDILLENILEDEHLSNVHKFTMCLPESYYGPGSYSKWIRVGWALKNESEKLIITWLKFSLQSFDTDFTDIMDLIDRWENFERYNSDGLSAKSIRFWVKQENKEEYDKIYKESIDYYIEKTAIQNQEYDLAEVLYELYKDKYVCISPSQNLWMEYQSQRWIPCDKGVSLRLKISEVLSNMYLEKVKEYDKKIFGLKNNENLVQQAANISNQIMNGDEENSSGDNPIITKLKKKRDIFNEIGMKKLRTTSWKSNIMKEAVDKFYDRNFIKKMDQNPYLLCFKNCVIDFKNGEIRNGRPDDYITKCTNTNYLKDNDLTDSKLKKIKGEINTFMEQLFPNENVRKYMWEHLASSLLGTNENQTFNIFNGSGANGKSKLIELMSMILGDYKGTVPISLVTQKRNGIGGTSSEIAQLIGVRYAVMQEPSKGDQINEGIMKELTGGDPIQCRQLFRESQVFIPQFKLVVCTNTLFEIKSQDDGTWRRLRLVDFAAKFTEKPNTNENPSNNNKFPIENYPYQFEIDTHLDDKFKDWAPVFMKMLVEIAMKKKGKVNDCPEVLEKTDEYRKDKDILNEFDSENIIREEGNNVTKTNLRETFKNWFEDKYDKRGMPVGKELYEWMNKKYGKCRNVIGWKNIAIVSAISMD
ncbi:hypothetical protein CL656_06190 [bacterium]|nr:hypothetical protein [bacterium]|tara:strand:+ start:3273 stop:6083 length:2811 start_codon:yes stop_codon:yes gene_type:complete